MDSVKVLEMGFFTCAHSHLQHLFTTDSKEGAAVRRSCRNGNSSGLWRTDVYKQDRQNFMSCVRRAGYKCRRGLIKLQPPGEYNMRGPSPRQINRSFLPPTNDDPSTLSVVDAVFFGADDREWGSNNPEEPHHIKTQGTTF